MALKLYFHPLASFCHKALIALYENRIPFDPIIVDLRDEASSAAFRAVWPMAKMPVLRDEARSGIDHHHRIPGRALSGPDALFARGCGSGLADPDVGPLLRPLRSGTHAEDRG
jgi:hypothetical protein